MSFTSKCFDSGCLKHSTASFLQLDAGAVLYGIADRDQYPILPARDEAARARRALCRRRDQRLVRRGAFLVPAVGLRPRRERQPRAALAQLGDVQLMERLLGTWESSDMGQREPSRRADYLDRPRPLGSMVPRGRRRGRRGLILPDFTCAQQIPNLSVRRRRRQRHGDGGDSGATCGSDGAWRLPRG